MIKYRVGLIYRKFNLLMYLVSASTNDDDSRVKLRKLREYINFLISLSKDKDIQVARIDTQLGIITQAFTELGFGDKAYDIIMSTWFIEEE